MARTQSAPPRDHLLLLGTRPLETPVGAFRLHVAVDPAQGRPALALTCGDPSGSQPLLARVHSSCVTSEIYGGCDCDCVEQLALALETIAEEGRGVVFYLMQEGRGAGFFAKVRDRMIVQASGNRKSTFDAYAELGLPADLRSYEDVGALVGLVGIAAPLCLLTNNPDKATGVATSAGIDVGDTRRIEGGASPWNRDYLAAKLRSGHGLVEPMTLDPAELPGVVENIAPRLLARAPRFLQVASYWLPVREPGSGAAHFFRLHAFADLVDGRERVVLAYDDGRGREPRLALQAESLLDRFPRWGSGDAWRDTRESVLDHGAGMVAFVPSEGFDASLAERAGAAEPSAELLAAFALSAGRLPRKRTANEVRDELLRAGVRGGAVRT